MASSFKSLDISRLIELLEIQSAAYTIHLKDGTESMEFKLCKTWIQLLQKEINSRQVEDAYISRSYSTVMFNEIEDSTNATPVLP